MHTIQLLDSQFNMNNKKLGRELMCNAEYHGILAEEQAGSRKHRRAVLSSRNMRLTIDIVRQKKKSEVIISNDAKSCYDRVAQNVAILAMRRLGAPKSAVTSMFQAFQKATHRVRTALEIPSLHTTARIATYRFKVLLKAMDAPQLAGSA